ncbi:MAG TPA: insulinase family protein, partial [Verrucomicrobiae bacterium]|nr:insulinase family protein [Verrucomicrobiae bacterium]
SKAGILMARESTSNRAEQLASQILTYGRPMPAEEIVARIEAVDVPHIARIARRLTAGAPTLAALGPLGRLARLDQVAARLAA